MRFRLSRLALAAVLLLAAISHAQNPTARPDGLYARIRTNKGVILVRLEPDLTPLTVASFVGLAEGSIANAAFDTGRPFFDGTFYHRVVPGHVIQTGIPKSDRARNPGYAFPNEIHARLSHNHAGALNMANAGPNTNSSQFCIMLGDRSYLDGNYTVFGDVVSGMDVVMSIVQGDVVESVRIERIGAKAQAFHPTTESFRAQLDEANRQVGLHADKKRAAEAEWLARNVPPAGSSTPSATPVSLRVRYRGRQLRYVGHWTGREGPPLDILPFGSEATGVPGFVDPPQTFTFDPGVTRINPGLDRALAAMRPGERRTIVVPAAGGYGRNGLTVPEVPGKRRFVIHPETTLIYEIEVLP